MATFGQLETDVEPLAGLMRDHIEIHDLVTQTREATEEALAVPSDADLAGIALERIRELDAYMGTALVLHIAREEDVLFPALRGLAGPIDQVVDEMVEQHDEVRFRSELLEQALAALDHTHDEVDGLRAEIAGRLADVPATPGPDALAGLLDAVKRLDWILQGHFGDEEDDLFAPALELLSAETFALLAEQSRNLTLQS